MYVIFFMLTLFLNIHIYVLKIFQWLPGTSQSKIICNFSLGKKIHLFFFFKSPV